MPTSLKCRLQHKWQKERQAAGISPPYVNPFLVTVSTAKAEPDFIGLLASIEARAKEIPCAPPPKLAGATAMKRAGWAMDQRRDKTGRLK